MPTTHTAHIFFLKNLTTKNEKINTAKALHLFRIDAVLHIEQVHLITVSSYFMLNTAHLYFSERGLDLDCTDVFFKTARISVPAPNKVRISYDYYKHILYIE